MRTDKELGAVRIMESLSAISEEFLERCEKADKAAAPKEGRNHRYVYRYALACAACLCLIVVGTAYYRLGHIRLGGAENASPRSSNGAAGMEPADGGAAPMDEPGIDEMALAEDMSAGGAPGSPDQAESFHSMGPDAEPEWLDVSSLTALPGEMGEYQAEVERMENAATSDEQDTIQLGVVVQMKASDRAEAARVPEGYSLVQADSDEAITDAEKAKGMESVRMYRWSNGECSLWLRITQTSLTADMRFEAEPPVYSVQESWQEFIPSAGADGRIRFALLYEDGALAEYCGCLSSGEIITLMESLADQGPVR